MIRWCGKSMVFLSLQKGGPFRFSPLKGEGPLQGFFSPCLLVDITLSSSSSVHGPTISHGKLHLSPIKGVPLPWSLPDSCCRLPNRMHFETLLSDCPLGGGRGQNPIDGVIVGAPFQFVSLDRAGRSWFVTWSSGKKAYLSKASINFSQCQHN